MKRFRFTLIAVCLFLIWLGWSDVSVFLRNRAPAETTASVLASAGPPREWLHVRDGYQDLERAINTSGTIEINALLVPLLTEPRQEKIRILVETRNPRVMQLFTDYHFKTDSAFEKEKFLADHRQEFHARRDVTGMLITGLIATSNRDKLLSLAQKTGLPVDDDVVFISEGKEPASARGFFFLATGLLGLGAIVLQWRKGVLGSHSVQNG